MLLVTICVWLSATAEVEEIRAKVAAEQRAKYEAQLNAIEDSAARASAKIQSRLEEAESENALIRQRLHEAAQAASQAGAENQGLRSELAEQVTALEQEIDALRANQTRIRNEHQRQREDATATFQEETARVINAEVAAERLRRRKSSLLHNFCSAPIDAANLRSELEDPMRFEDDICIGASGGLVRVPWEQAADSRLRGTASSSADGFPAHVVSRRVAGAGAAGMSHRLASDALPALGAVRPELSQEVGDALESAWGADAGERCCDDFVVLTDPSVGFMYSMRMPLGGDGGAADGTYRKVCFRRDWETHSGAQVEDLGLGLLPERDGADLPEEERSVYMVWTVSPRSLTTFYRAVRSLVEAAGWEMSSQGSRLRMVVLLSPLVAPKADSLEAAAPLQTPTDLHEDEGLSSSELDRLLSHMAVNATRMAAGAFAVQVVPGLKSDDLAAEPLTRRLEVLAGAERAAAELERANRVAALGSTRKLDEGRMVLTAPWAAAVIAALELMPHGNDVVVILDPTTVAVPHDVLSQTLRRVVPAKQAFVPVMEAEEYVNRAGFGAQQPGAAPTVPPPGQGMRHRVPSLTTLATTKDDIAWVLLSLLRSGSSTGDGITGATDSGVPAHIHEECAVMRFVARMRMLGIKAARPYTPGLELAPSAALCQQGFDDYFAGACECTAPVSRAGHCSLRTGVTEADVASDRAAVACALAQSTTTRHARSSIDEDLVYRTVRYVDPTGGMEIVAHVDRSLVAPDGVPSTPGGAGGKPVVLRVGWRLGETVAWDPSSHDAGAAHGLHQWLGT